MNVHEVYYSFDHNFLVGDEVVQGLEKYEELKKKLEDQASMLEYLI